MPRKSAKQIVTEVVTKVNEELPKKKTAPKKEEPKTGGIKIDEVTEERKNKLKDITFEIFYPNLDTFNEEKGFIIEEPTVDEILEKITEKGIESLTEKEKEILNNYGKN